MRNPLEVALAQFGLRPDRDHLFRTVGVASDGFLDRQQCAYCGVVVEDDIANPPPPCIPRERAPHRNLDNLPEQVETAFALQLGGVRGIRTDAVRVEALRRTAQAKRDEMTRRYQKIGFLR